MVSEQDQYTVGPYPPQENQNIPISPNLSVGVEPLGKRPVFLRETL